MRDTLYMNRDSALTQACHRFGSQAALARALGITPMAVSHWKSRGVPLRQAFLIERMTEGAVRAQELCPEWLNESSPGEKSG